MNVPFTFCNKQPKHKAVREGGGGNGGHVLRETTNRGRCELVCPSSTTERGREGYCVKEGEGEGDEADFAPPWSSGACKER
jgi:hypothetical protein